MKLPQPGGNCSGAAIAASDLVDAQGDAVTFEPPLSQLASPGGACAGCSAQRGPSKGQGGSQSVARARQFGAVCCNASSPVGMSVWLFAAGNFSASASLPLRWIAGKTTYTVRKALGGECTANVTVERCGTCAQMNIKVWGALHASTYMSARMSLIQRACVLDWIGALETSTDGRPAAPLPGTRPRAAARPRILPPSVQQSPAQALRPECLPTDAHAL